MNQDQCVRLGRGNEALQQYIQALLARQHALDLLESTHQQIKDTWTTLRGLLEGLGFPQKANKVVRHARAAQACAARDAYRALEKRRDECVAALHDAERRARDAWKAMFSSRSTSKTPRLSAPAGGCRGKRSAWYSNRRNRLMVKVNSTVQLA